MLTRLEIASILKSLSALLNETEVPSGELEKLPGVAANKETDADTLKWIEMILAGGPKAIEAQDKLYSKYSERVHFVIGIGAKDVPEDIREEWALMAWDSIFKLLPDYDPKKSLFKTWISNIADTVRRRNISKYFAIKRRGVLSIAAKKKDDDDDENGDIGIVDKPQEISPFEFTENEQKLAEELKQWLKDIENGKIPLPYKIVPRRYPWETKEEVMDRDRRMRVDMFRSFYGIGTPRMLARQISDKYAQEMWDREPEAHRRWILINVCDLPEGHADNLSKLAWKDLPDFIDGRPVRQKMILTKPEITQYMKRWYSGTGTGAVEVWAKKMGKEHILRSLMSKILHLAGRRPTAVPIIEWAKLRKLLAALIEV